MDREAQTESERRGAADVADLRCHDRFAMLHHQRLSGTDRRDELHGVPVRGDQRREFLDRCADCGFEPIPPGGSGVHSESLVMALNVTAC